MAADRKDVWASGEAYEPYVGRWSRLVAREFVAWLGVGPGAAWLDVGCGTGALTQTILDSRSPKRVTGVDPSDGFVAFARHKVADPRAAFEVGDAQALPVADGAFDAAVSGLVINFVPDQAKAVREMRRATRSKGTVAAYVWDYAGEMQMMRRFWDAAVALDAAPRRSTRAGGFRFATVNRSRISSGAPASSAWRCAPSTRLRCSRISTTTGRRSSVASGPRRPTVCRFRRSSGPPCATTSAPACRLAPTEASISSPERGRRVASCRNATAAIAELLEEGCRDVKLAP